MGSYVSNETIRALRTQKGLTQEQLAAQVGVTAKAVSKWETGRGLPDVSLLEPLASALGVSIAELITGDVATNTNRSANVKCSLFHVCPVCGNVVWSLGGISASCCGVQMIPLEPERDDDSHTIQVEKSDGDHVITVDHPMDKDHYISFIAAVSDDEVRMHKLYPQQEALARFHIRPAVRYFAYCNRHGLIETAPQRAVRKNEKKHGAEARKRYGDAAVDAANERIISMDSAEWNTKEELELAIIQELKAALGTDPAGPAGKKISAMHAQWIGMQWGKGAYSPAAHVGLTATYLADDRFVEYYDSRAGIGATDYLVQAIKAHIS